MDDSHYRLLFENNPQPTCVIDRKSLRFLAVNPAAIRHYGYQREEFLARNLRDLFPASELPRFHADLEARCTQATPDIPWLSGVWEQHAKDGTRLRVTMLGSPVVLDRTDAVLIVVHDVTQQQQAEEALRQSEEYHRLLAELTSDYCYSGVVHPDGRFEMTSVTGGFQRVTGYSVAELEQEGGWKILIPPEDLASSVQTHARMLTGVPDVVETRIRTKAGATRWVRFSMRPIWDAAQGRVVRLLGAVQEITERKEAEEKLQEYNQRLQVLSRRLLEVQEQERRYLARELHDEIGQLLTGLKLTLEMDSRAQPGKPVEHLDKGMELVKDLTSRIRDLSSNLRPTLLDDLGLLPALLWHVRRYQARTSVEVRFEHHGLDRRFSARVETAAYRIVQEALTNVARHAGVKEVTVRCWPDEGKLYVQIEDRGAGFDLQAAQACAVSSGLSGMVERAALLGGHLTVDTRPAAGTRVVAELPVEEAESGDPWR